MILLKVIKAIVVRLALILHVLVTVWRVTVDLDDDIYWLLCVLMVPFFIETAYTIIKRGGEDFRLFTPCFFFYLITTIPSIWLLELKKSDIFLDDDKEEETVAVKNVTVTKQPIGPDFGVDINPGTWTVLIEELLLYLLILSRWILPRGKVSREQLSDLLFAFIGIASDIMEMFSLFGLEDVRRNRILSYFVLSCWTVSVLQFCMTVTVIHEPRRAKVIKTIDDNDYEKKKPKIWREIGAVVCSMFMQDIPFLTLRLYTIITYNIINYSLIFFTSKNILVILLLLYKVAVLLQKRYCPEFLLDPDVDEEKIYGDDSVKDKDGCFHHIKEELSDDSGSSKEKAKSEQFYGKDNSGKMNRGFEGDRNKPVKDGANGSPLSHPNENTPLRQRKGDNSQPTLPQDSIPSSRPSSSIQSDQTVSTEATPNQPKNSPVSSGYGWVSSKSKGNGN